MNIKGSRQAKELAFASKSQRIKIGGRREADLCLASAQSPGLEWPAVGMRTECSPSTCSRAGPACGSPVRT